MSRSMEGGCLCGRVRYRIDGEPIISATCQCRSCRRAGAAAIVPWIHLDASTFTYTAARPVEYASSAGVTRTFCGQCGTPLTYRKASYGPMLDVTTCSLDDPDAFPPMAHFWASHALRWLRLSDELPRFEEGPPES